MTSYNPEHELNTIVIDQLKPISNFLFYFKTNHKCFSLHQEIDRIEWIFQQHPN
jgi:hypothetical protein